MIKRRNRTFKHQASQPPQAKYRRMAEIVRARLEARKKAEEEEAEQKQRAETEPERKYSPHRSVDPSDGLTNGSAGSAGDKATAGSVAPNTNSSGVVVKQEPGTAGSLASKDRADQNDADDEVPSEEAIAEMNEEVDALKKQKSLLYFKLKEILRVEQEMAKAAEEARRMGERQDTDTRGSNNAEAGTTGAGEEGEDEEEDVAEQVSRATKAGGASVSSCGAGSCGAGTRASGPGRCGYATTCGSSRGAFGSESRPGMRRPISNGTGRGASCATGGSAGYSQGPASASAGFGGSREDGAGRCSRLDDGPSVSGGMVRSDSNLSCSGRSDGGSSNTASAMHSGISSNQTPYHGGLGPPGGGGPHGRYMLGPRPAMGAVAHAPGLGDGGMGGRGARSSIMGGKGYNPYQRERDEMPIGGPDHSGGWGGPPPGGAPPGVMGAPPSSGRSHMMGGWRGGGVRAGMGMRMMTCMGGGGSGVGPPGRFHDGPPPPGPGGGGPMMGAGSGRPPPAQFAGSGGRFGCGGGAMGGGPPVYMHPASAPPHMSPGHNPSLAPPPGPPPHMGGPQHFLGAPPGGAWGARRRRWVEGCRPPSEGGGDSSKGL
mmetsp:Transcript_20638/g.63031  ORF Transcript_20638/g.63031 Transcript_20638/m.63031 type:complete len:599 (-) Transcript_20638:297-2093(-)